MATRQNAESETVSAHAPLSAADAIAAAKTAQKNTTTAAQEVDERGFVFLPNKRKLIGKAFTIIDVSDVYEAIDGYWQMTIRLVAGDKALFIRDTSKGIREQILKIGEDAIKMTHWPRGLRVSDYHIEGRPASTFYLDDEAL